MKLNPISLLLLTSAMLLSVSCRDSELKRMPDTLPDIRGNIAQVSIKEQNSNDDYLILVKATGKEDKRVTEASIKVSNKTKIEDHTGKDLSVHVLKQGQEVDVWFGDKIMDSSPVQADAIAIKIRSQE
jgi:DNA repair exonuclease SbcCD nuclease subunit